MKLEHRGIWIEIVGLYEILFNHIQVCETPSLSNVLKSRQTKNQCLPHGEPGEYNN